MRSRSVCLVGVVVTAAVAAPWGGLASAAVSAAAEATTAVALVATPSGTEGFYRVAGGSVAHRTYVGGAWSQPADLGGRTEFAPAAARGGNRVVVAVTGTDGTVRCRVRPDAGSWTTWTPIGGSASSAPAVLAFPDGTLDVFVRGRDDALWLRRGRPGSGWSPWQSLGGVATSAPAALRGADGSLWVAATGTDHLVHLRRYANLSWSGWRAAPISTNSAPALAALTGRLVVMVRSRANTLMTGIRSSAGTWSAHDLGGTVVDTPGTAPGGADRLTVAVRSSDLGVWTTSYDGATRTAFVRGWPPVTPPPCTGCLGTVRGALPTTGRTVALTFDVEAAGDAVASIRRTLLSRGVPATFFVTGDFARRHPETVALLASTGYVIGNHSDTHPVFTTLTDDQILAQLAAARGAVTLAAGVETRPLFRYPYGQHAPHDLAVVNAAGYVAVGWNVDAQGWRGVAGGNSVGNVVATTLRQVRAGSVVLMHAQRATDGTTLDAAALPTVIDRLRAAGYAFTTVRAFGG